LTAAVVTKEQRVARTKVKKAKREFDEDET
jgi:hypothetical protein